MTNNIKNIEILMIEDNPDDIRLTLESFYEFKIKNNLHIIKNGQDAIDFLYKKGKYSSVPSPDLILLDLKLPKKNGFEVLKEIKSDKNLQKIPVIIFSTSDTKENICKAYELQANCYIVKPIEFNQFLLTIKLIADFWLSIAKIPE
ncbi:MAG: response regulator [Armatimonadetes bacterium]|nr:response regulator [Armatimonadota bacterium]